MIKKMNLLLMIFISLLVLLTACKGSSGSPSSIEGKWHVGGNDYLVFADGKYTVTDKAGSSVEEKGVYSVKGDVLTTTSSSSEARSFKIVSNDGKVMTVKKMKRGRVSRREKEWKKVD